MSDGKQRLTVWSQRWGRKEVGRVGEVVSSSPWSIRYGMVPKYVWYLSNTYRAASSGHAVNFLAGRNRQ